MLNGVQYMNSNDKCIACGKGKRKGRGNIKVNGKFNKATIPLIKHHVRYNPEIIAYVHFECHEVIHDEDDPRYKHLIQYEEGESREYYDNKNR